MERVFELTRSGMIMIWKWVDERSDGFKRALQFTLQKRGKKKGIPDDIYNNINEEEYKEEIKYMSNFEKGVINGRYILEKKQKFELSGAKVYYIYIYIYIDQPSRIQ